MGLSPPVFFSVCFHDVRNGLMIWLAFLNSCYGQTELSFSALKLRVNSMCFLLLPVPQYLFCFVTRLLSKDTRNPSSVLASSLSWQGVYQIILAMLVMDKKVDAVSLQNKAKLTKLKILFSINPFSPVTATTTREFQLNSHEELQLKLMFLVPFILQKHAGYVCWRYVSCCCKHDYLCCVRTCSRFFNL